MDPPRKAKPGQKGTLTGRISGYNDGMATPVTSKSEIFERLRAHRERLRALGVARIGVFGSFVNGTPGPDSDVDLLVEFAPGVKRALGWAEIFDLAEAEFGRSVDVITPESLSKYCASRILTETEYVSLHD